MLLTATLESVLPATPRAYLLRVAPEHPLAFAAGQAAAIGQPGQGLRRPYSIAVGPEEAARDRRLEFLVGAGPDGSVGPHLPELAVGMTLDLEGPFGTFTFPADPPERHFLFVAGGSGVAPLRSMLHHALSGDPSWRLSMIYSARTPDEFAFDTELTALAADKRIRYRRTATRDPGPDWAGDRGRVSRALLETVVEDDATLCFVCGPESLVHEVPRMLLEMGVAPGRVRVDEWAGPPSGRASAEEA